MMRLLHKFVARGQPRDHLVTREEWEALFAPFPPEARYHMANLAAHNWEIVYDGDRVAALTASQGGHWVNLAGERTEITPEEWDAFYPRADKSKRWTNGYTAHWLRDKHGNTGEAIVRQEEIVLPAAESAVCPACGGAGRIGPFFPGGLSAVCANCTPTASKGISE